MADAGKSSKSETGKRKESSNTDLGKQYDRRFEEAVNGAQYLIEHISNNPAIEIDKGLIGRLIETRTMLVKGEQVTKEIETEFWVAYDELCRLAHPATVEGIRANLPLENSFIYQLYDRFPVIFKLFRRPNITKSNRTMFGCAGFSLIILLLVLSLQIYWSIGNQLSVQLDRLLDAEKNLLVAKIEDPQKVNEDEINSLNIQILQTSLVYLNWSNLWKAFFQNDGLHFDTEFTQAISVKELELDQIKSQLQDDPTGILAAENHKDYLDAQNKIIPENEKLDDKIVLVDYKTFLEQELTGLETKRNNLQNQIEDLNEKRNSLEAARLKLTTTRESNLADLTARRSFNQVLLDDILGQLEKLGVPKNPITPTATPTPTVSSADVSSPDSPVDSQSGTIPTSTSNPTPTSTPTQTPPPSPTFIPTRTATPNASIEALKAERDSLIAQIEGINNLYEAELNNTGEINSIEKQINDIDAQLTVDPALVDAFNDQSSLKKDLGDYPVFENNKYKTDEETKKNIKDALINMIGESVPASPGALSVSRDDPASQLAVLDGTMELIRTRIEELKITITSIQIEVDTLDEGTKQELQMKKENVGKEIVKQANSKKTLLESEIADLKRQELAASIREDSAPAQLEGRYVLDILQNNILPLLYGVLGAAAYVLRSLVRRNRERSYSNAAALQHLVHISLGALAGILVGWFSFLITKDDLIGSISPMAIAFLVGYNIELIFTKMDEIVVPRINDILKQKSFPERTAASRSSSNDRESPE